MYKEVVKNMYKGVLKLYKEAVKNMYKGVMKQMYNGVAKKMYSKGVVQMYNGVVKRAAGHSSGSFKQLKCQNNVLKPRTRITMLTQKL